jgi:hypothetical protein
MVNGSGRVFVEREGQLALVDQVTVREQNLRVAVRNLARALGDDISEERPLLDSRLPDGSRVAAALLNIVVKIHPNESGTPPSKLADAELHFAGGELDGLKLVGFSIWRRRGGNGPTVSFPGQQYRIGEERRTFALLRPIADVSAQERVRDLVLDAYANIGRDAASGPRVRERM